LKDTIVWELERAGGLTANDIGKAEVARTDLYHRTRQFFERHEFFVLPAVHSKADLIVECDRSALDIPDGGFSTAFKEAFPRGDLGEALGFVPHVWSVYEDWAAAARLGKVLPQSAPRWRAPVRSGARARR